MADLLDIAPATAVEVVTIDGKRIKVSAISFGAIASIVARFQRLRSIGAGGDIVMQLITGFGEAIGPIIAAGCGHLNDDKYEQRAAELSPDNQLKLLRAIVCLTFPNGLRPFLEAMNTLMGGAENAKPVKVRLKASRLPSQQLSGSESRQNMQ